MNKKNYNRKKLFIDLLFISIIFTLTSLIGEIIGLELSLFKHIILVAIISMIIKSFLIYPITFLISFILGFLSMLFINKYKFPIFVYIRDKLSILITNIVGNIQNLEPILENNILFLYIIIVIFVSLSTAIIIYKLEKISFLLPLYLLIFLLYWYSFIDIAYLHIAIFITLFLILFGLDKYKTDKKTDTKLFNIWTRTSVVYSLLIISIAFFLPKSNNYISWPTLQQKIYNVFPVVEDLRYYKDYNRKTSNSKLFNFSTSNFSEKDKDLGGPIVLNERKVMTVQSNQPVYLRGNVKHLYTGRSWISMSSGFPEYYLNQSFYPFSDSEKKRYYTSEQLYIQFDSFSSNTIFAPYKPTEIILNNNTPILVNDDDIITCQDGIYKNEGYGVEYLKPLPYKTLIKNRIYKDKNDLTDISSYLEILENIITDRTKQLTSSLVENLYTDYEKAIAIQNHLRDNYKYNLNVKNLPEGKDFIDNFLFEEKEGYCTSFASAMTIMLRLEDIPSRYIEGYIVSEKIGEDRYQVRQKHAHTWVEAFIEPVGWMSFEPTAAYETLTATQEKEDDIKEETPENKTETIKPTDEKEPTIDVEDTKIDIDKKFNKKTYMVILLASIILLFIFTIIRILIRSIKYKSKQNNINALSDKDKIIYIYKDIVDLLDILGFPLLKGETHHDYAERISSIYIYPNKSKIKDITATFVRLKYSDEYPLSSEILSIVEYRDFLDIKIKEKLGKWKYFYRKYINIYFKKKKELP